MRLEVECDPNLDEVVTDRLKVKQIVTNLITNAIKFGKRRDGREGVISVSFNSVDGYYWKFFVADEGRGIRRKNFTAYSKSFIV